MKKKNSPSRTGPFTLRMMRRFWSSRNLTRTWVTCSESYSRRETNATPIRVGGRGAARRKARLATGASAADDLHDDGELDRRVLRASGAAGRIPSGDENPMLTLGDQTSAGPTLRTQRTPSHAATPSKPGRRSHGRQQNCKQPRIRIALLRKLALCAAVLMLRCSVSKLCRTAAVP